MHYATARAGSSWAGFASAVAIGVCAAIPLGDRAVAADDDDILTLPIARTEWTGDFNAMLERRMIRILIPPSRTLFFNDRGRDMGITAEIARDFETYLNQKYRKELKNRPLTVALIPTTRNVLLPHVVAGLGDIAAGDLTVTDERLQVVDFVAPTDFRPVSELVLTGPKSAPIASVADLSGRTVHVRPSSSYHESLVSLNERFQAAGKPPVQIVAVPTALEDEDMMEMLDAGLFDVIVVDDWMAKMWAQVLPHVVVHDNVAVRTGGHIGWATRKESPELRAVLEDFYENHEKKQGTIEYRLVQYNKKIKRLQDPTGREDWKRFEQIVELFEKYGKQYGFDPLLLAAQGYQESKLDQGARGPTGAVGVMQLMPATGASLQVGDITVTEPNIHAGAKYMNELATKYFPDAKFSELDRSLFSFAAYNAGPGRVASLRKTAAARGLEPDVWFNNVEIIAAEKIGRETTTYVRNIYKYYVSYKLTMEIDAAEKKARESLTPSPGGSTRPR